MIRAMQTVSEAPEVRGVPGLGCVPWMISDGPAFLLRTARERGPTFRARMGPGSMLVVSHPADLRTILHDHAKNFVRGNTVDLIRPLLGNGLPLSDGDFWLKQRRTMQPAFNRGHIQSLTRLMGEVCQRRIADAPVGATIDVHQFFTLLARDMIVETMFSDSLGGDTRAIDGAFMTISEFTGSRAFLPVRIPLDWPLPSNKRFHEAVRVIDETIDRIVARRKGGESRDDLLDALLHARDPETGEPMQQRHLRDELVTIFFAGHETTANLLTWTCVELSKHPEWARRMRDEVLAKASDRALVAEDVHQLSVTNAILREALRLHPPAWIFARQGIEDDALSGVRVRAREVALICPYITHRLEEFWPDPDVFDPQRFLDANPYAMGGGRDAHYVPFGSGPHVCIGNHFAITEAVVALAALAKHGRFSLLAPERVKNKVGATLSASNTDARVKPWK
jgi:cytochrome P450